MDQRSGFHTPASREQEYSPITRQDVSFDASIDSLPDSSGLRDLRRSVTVDHNGPESQQLSPNDMIAPQSAVHSMSVNLLGSNNVSRLEINNIVTALTKKLQRYSWTPQQMVIQEAILSRAVSLRKSELGSCMKGMHDKLLANAKKNIGDRS